MQLMGKKKTENNRLFRKKCCLTQIHNFKWITEIIIMIQVYE